MNQIAKILMQDKIWVDRFGREYDLETMDPHYRSNLIPFLRGNAQVLQRHAEANYLGSSLAMVDDPSDGVFAAQMALEDLFEVPAEVWLERTPLMRRLVALEQGVPLLTRAAWAAKNKAYEIKHGYKKIRTNQ